MLGGQVLVMANQSGVMELKQKKASIHTVGGLVQGAETRAGW